MLAVYQVQGVDCVGQDVQFLLGVTQLPHFLNFANGGLDELHVHKFRGDPQHLGLDVALEDRNFILLLPVFHLVVVCDDENVLVDKPVDEISDELMKLVGGEIDDESVVDLVENVVSDFVDLAFVYKCLS